MHLWDSIAVVRQAEIWYLVAREENARMPKAGEIRYLQASGEHGAAFAADKPFSDPDCGQHLVALGALRMLLPPPPARLLDLGCGTGWTSCMFAQMGYDVVGQDIAPDMIHYANIKKQRYRVPHVRFITSDYESMRQP